MARPRLDHGALQRLNGALLDEAELSLASLGEPSRRGWLRLMLRGRSAQAEAACQRAAETTDHLFADASGANVETAKLELDAIRPQVPTLMWFALEWELRRELGDEAGRAAMRSGKTGARRPTLYPPAVEALTNFYFGEPGGDDDLLAETQLAWMACRQLSPLMILLRRSVRDRRDRAVRRYSELWEQWASANGSGSFAV